MPVHVAILLPRYLRLVLEGRKTVESRLTRNLVPPFGAIAAGQRIYFKASSGPYMATAVAGAVECHDRLTPEAIAQLRQRHNERVCGDEAYWQWKRSSRYATFIELTRVEATGVGPALAPSRGPAWFVLDDAADPSLEVVLTAGAIRNAYLRWPASRPACPPAGELAAAGSTAGEPIHLLLPDGQTVTTDVVSRGMLRWRGWRRWLAAWGAQPGDRVALIAVADRRYRVSFVPQGRAAQPGSRD